MRTKSECLERWAGATKLNIDSTVDDFLAVFPSWLDLEEFERDAGQLSWPGSFGHSPWSWAYHIAWCLANGQGPSIQGAATDSEWMEFKTKQTIVEHYRTQKRQIPPPPMDRLRREVRDVFALQAETVAPEPTAPSGHQRLMWDILQGGAR